MHDELDRGTLRAILKAAWAHRRGVRRAARVAWDQVSHYGTGPTSTESRAADRRSVARVVHGQRRRATDLWDGEDQALPPRRPHCAAGILSPADEYADDVASLLVRADHRADDRLSWRTGTAGSLCHPAPSLPSGDADGKLQSDIHPGCVGLHARAAGHSLWRGSSTRRGVAPPCREASLGEWRQDLDELAKRPGEIVNADMAKHISTLAHALSRRGAGKEHDAAALEPLMGRRPLSFREFIRARKGRFANQSVGPSR